MVKNLNLLILAVQWLLKQINTFEAKFHIGILQFNNGWENVFINAPLSKVEEFLNCGYSWLVLFGMDFMLDIILHFSYGSHKFILKDKFLDLSNIKHQVWGYFIKNWVK
jgi:hypothetical protein